MGFPGFYFPLPFKKGPRDITVFLRGQYTYVLSVFLAGDIIFFAKPFYFSAAVGVGWIEDYFEAVPGPVLEQLDCRGGSQGIGILKIFFIRFKLCLARMCYVYIPSPVL